MGAAGYENHIVICGWNATARDLVEELRTDDYGVKMALLHDSEKNPAGDGVYFVRGDSTAIEDLDRAGIRHASAAIICPTDAMPPTCGRCSSSCHRASPPGYPRRGEQPARAA
jgi:voltage-gated potassium channel